MRDRHLLPTTVYFVHVRNLHDHKRLPCGHHISDVSYPALPSGFRFQEGTFPVVEMNGCNTYALIELL